MERKRMLRLRDALGGRGRGGRTGFDGDLEGAVVGETSRDEEGEDEGEEWFDSWTWCQW